MSSQIEVMGIVDYRSPRIGLSDIAKSGFENLSLDLRGLYAKSNSPEKDEPRKFSESEIYDTYLYALIDEIKSYHIDIKTVRIPSISFDADEIVNESVGKWINTAYRLSEIADIKNIIAPAISYSSASDAIEKNIGFYRKIAEIAKRKNIKLLFENSVRCFNGHYIRSNFSGAGKLVDLVSETNRAVGSEVFGICMNLKKCTLCGIDPYEFAVSAGDKINTVIISDCNGTNNMSMMPFTAVNGGYLTEWNRVLSGFRTTRFSGDVIFDISDAIAFAQPLMRTAMLEYTKSAASFLTSQLLIVDRLKKYKNIVLFGAGNILPRYMTALGGEFPPLFICDNNKSLWGTKRFNTEIRSPETLKDLPEDCVIVISNVIYCREIERQIIDMGVKAPIEFFAE